MSADTSEPKLSLGAKAARNLATATVTAPQMSEITPRWLHKLLPWVDIDRGVYRVNRRKHLVDGVGRVSATISGDQAKLVPASLRSVPIFSGFTDGNLGDFAGRFATERFAANGGVANEGDASRKFYVVVSGKVELSVVGPHGDKLRQALLSDGAFRPSWASMK